MVNKHQLKGRIILIDKQQFMKEELWPVHQGKELFPKLSWFRCGYAWIFSLNYLLAYICSDMSSGSQYKTSLITEAPGSLNTW